MDSGVSVRAPVIVSVDVEDWPQSTWDHSREVTSRAERNTQRLLDLLAAHERRITMFVLGKFAERFPKVVERMSREGHEVASHGFGHVETFHLTPAQFREDVHRSKRLLEDIVGTPVIGYRAPDFSIVDKTIWALDVLADEGFTYDSSIFPVKNGRYGIPSWPIEPTVVELPSGNTIVELPIASLQLFDRRWPVAGGGYHRLLPWPVIKWAMNRCLRQNGVFMAYCHPYEFDASEFAELDFDVPLKTKLHQGIGRRGFEKKFRNILTTFENVQARHVAAGHGWHHHRVPQHTAASKLEIQSVDRIS